MHATTLWSAVVLAPALALLLGFLTVVALPAVGVGTSLPRQVALVATAVALGMAARFWISARAGAWTVRLVSANGPAAQTLDVRVDLLTSSCIVTALLTGIAYAAGDGRGRPAVARPALLLTLACVTALFLCAGVAAFTVLWVAVVLLGAVEAIAVRDLAAATPLLSLAFCGAPVLVVSGAAIASAGGGSPIALTAPPNVVHWAALSIALVGAASAGLTPLNGWTRGAAESGSGGLVVNAALPLAGFYLAARALQVGGTGGLIALTALLAVVGLWGVGDAAHSAFTARSLTEQVQSVGRGELGLAFVGLAIGTESAVSVALFLAACEVLARTAAQLADRVWLIRLGWASTVGFPPLPGFVGRWLLVATALAAGSWPLAIAIVLAALLLDLAVFANQTLAIEGERPNSALAPALLALTALAGLVPSRLLMPALFPLAFLPGLAFRPPSAAATVLALVAALAPVLVVPVVAKSRVAPPHRDVSRTIQELAWDAFERLADGLAGFVRIVEGRYNVAAAFIVIVIAIFAFVR